MDAGDLVQRRAVCVIVTISLLGLAVAGCVAWMMRPDDGGARSSSTTETPHGDSSSVQGEASDGAAHVLDARSVAALDEAVRNAADLSGAGYRSLASARPSLLADGQGGRTVMSIHDVDETTWEAGSYRLTVYCMGSGSLDVSFSIGEDRVERTMSCAADVAQESLSLRTAGASEGHVGIVPSDNAVSEIAYWIAADGE